MTDTHVHTPTRVRTIVRFGLIAAIIATVVSAPAWFRYSIDRREERQRELDKRLCIAAYAGKLPEMRDLVRAGANVNCVTRDTPLSYALSGGHCECADFLLANGAKGLDSRSTSSMSLLSNLARFEPKSEPNTRLQLQLADKLIRAGNDARARDRSGYTPLHWAAVSGSTALARVLIADGADVNDHREGDPTPLLFAAGYGKLEMVKLLLEHGADTTIRGAPYKNTPIEEARRYKKTAVAEYLVRWQREHP